MIYNGTFDSDVITDKIPPFGWKTCDVYSDPNIMSSYQYNVSDPVILPFDGTTFMAMRARGVNYMTESNHLRRTREYLAQKLPVPLEKKTCYHFSIYLLYDQYDSFIDSLEPNVSYPVALEMWVGNDSCAHEKRMFVTKTVSNTSWQKYDADFITPDTVYSSIRLQVQWDTLSIKPIPYNGEMFLDFAQLFKTKNVDSIVADTIYYHGDNKTNLVAVKGLSYNWSASAKLSNYNIQSILMKEFSKSVEVKIFNGTSCPTIEKFNLILNCDTLYPNETIKTYYYKYFKSVVLKATDGIIFDWEPKINLSAYDIQGPILTGFHDKYNVIVKDKYSCISQEEFNIFANCDSLYPSQNVLILDTSFMRQTEILLVPKVGKITGFWNPSRWLSCIDCQTPVASPEYATTYSVYLIDSFKCYHYESFKIGIQLSIPNVITPNGDGFNDCFKLIGVPENTIIRIFDKSGLNVFSANNYGDSNCWQGKDNNGHNLETGTYWYFLDNREIGFNKKGFVFLKR